MSKYNMCIDGVSVEAVFNKLGGVDGARSFLRGELVLTKAIPKWREEGGVIYFSVISDGTTGEGWIKRLEGKGIRFEDYAKRVLCSRDFKPTNGVTTEVAVLKSMLFENNELITKNIRAEADKRKLETPNAELACLIREKFTDKEIGQMGLQSILAMHEPINDSCWLSVFLCVQCGNYSPWIQSHNARSEAEWFRDGGFAFAVSQVAGPQI